MQAGSTLAGCTTPPIAIPRSSSDKHIKSNFEIADLKLSQEETGRINSLRSPDGRLIDPDWAPDWDK